MTKTSAKILSTLLAGGVWMSVATQGAAQQNGAPPDAQRFKVMIGKWKGEGTLNGGKQPVSSPWRIVVTTLPPAGGLPAS